MQLVDSAHSLYLKINQIDDAVREAFYTFKRDNIFHFVKNETLGTSLQKCILCF